MRNNKINTIAIASYKFEYRPCFLVFMFLYIKLKLSKMIVIEKLYFALIMY